MDRNIHISHPILQESIKKDIIDHKIIFLSAPYGWGKTYLFQRWAKEQSTEVIWVSGTECSQKQLEEIESQMVQYFVFEDFQKISNIFVHERITELIEKSRPETRFIFLSRSGIPAFLRISLLSGQLILYTLENMKIPFEEAVIYLRKNGVALSSEEKTLFKKAYPGYPVYIAHIKAALQDRNKKLDERLIENVKREIFESLNFELIDKWSPKIQRFLMSIAGLQSFDLELSRILYGWEDVEEVIEEILHMECFMTLCDTKVYCIEEFFNEYLVHVRDKRMSGQQVCQLHNLIGSYYEEHNLLYLALDYYKQGGNRFKVQAILINIARKGATTFDYQRLKPFFLFLTEEELMSHPSLAGGMAMLYSITYQPQQSDCWFQKILDQYKGIDKEDPIFKELTIQIKYLQIALPHTGMKGMMKIAYGSISYIRKNKLKMPIISITGSRPSILNGGKDFCNWSRNLYIIRRSFEGVLSYLLGEQSAGIMGIWVGEVEYERGNLNIAIEELVKGVDESEQYGTVDILFAGISVLVRLMMAENQLDSALDLMRKIRKIIDDKGEIYLLPNWECLLMKLMMLKGELGMEGSWFDESAPNEELEFCITDRYSYSIKIRSYILRRKYDQALDLADKLYKYAVDYECSYDYMEMLLLKAIILYRMNDESWKVCLTEVMNKAYYFQFIRILADEGIALYPLLNKLLQDDKFMKGIDKSYFDKVYNATRKMSLQFPKYLAAVSNVKISRAERDIAMHLVKGIKNKEIAAALNLSENTVKFHLKNLYKKLEVDSKSRAILIMRDLMGKEKGDIIE